MSGRWTIVATALACLVVAATSGCVAKDEYDKAVAASRRANDGLLKCQSALKGVRADSQALQDELAKRDTMLAYRNDLLDKLKSGNADMDQAFKDLLAKYQKALDRKPEPLGPLTFVLPPAVDAALRGLAKEYPGLMEYLPKYGMLKLKSDLTFAKGSAVLKGPAEAVLAKLGEIVGTPEAQKFHVYAAGHTDDIPLRKPDTISKHGSNWGLSLHRAGAVVKALAAAGVEQRRLGAVGFSKWHPIAPNKPGQKGNPLNRRVEIWIVPPDRFLTTSTSVQPEK